MAGKRPCRVVRAIAPSSRASRAPRQWWMPWPKARWLVSARVRSRVSGLAYRAGSRLAAASEMITWAKAGMTVPPRARPFLTGLEAPWIDEWRRRLEEVRLRGLECFAAASLGLGGPALAQAEERARMLTELSPYRETGHRLLMEALARRGNVAEALRAYERLRVLLREELGIVPSPAVQGVHRRLLQGAGS